MLFSKMLFEFKNNKNMYNNKNSTLKLIQEWKNPKKL